jgi:hypothetical protein
MIKGIVQLFNKFIQTVALLAAQYFIIEKTTEKVKRRQHC